MAFDKDSIIASLKEATILDLADLVSAIEEEFGVSAAAPVQLLVQLVVPKQPRLNLTLS